MSWLVGNSSTVWEVAAKGALIYATALLALRMGERRTLAQLTLIDFATAVALGAIIGRTAVAGSQSYLTGAVAVATLVVAHRLASLLRFQPLLAKLVDHRVRVLFADGKLRRWELRRCGLTDTDVFTQLRMRGLFSLDEVRYVIYEPMGTMTIVPAAAPAHPDPPLVEVAIERAAGYP